MESSIDEEEKEEEDEEKNEEEKEPAVQKRGLITSVMAAIDKKQPKLGALLRDIRVQAVLIFLILLVFYLNLIIWDFYFSSDSVPYGLTMKEWFEEGRIDNYELLRPAHPLTMPSAILFTYIVRPITGSDYLLSFAALNAILGAATVAMFYLVCYVFSHNRKFSFLCALGLAFSFAFWENCEMAEDKSLGFLLFVLYIPILFSFYGEIHPFARFEKLKPWQKGFLTGLFMGLVIIAHFSFVLVFLFSVVLGLRFRKYKLLKSLDFYWFLIGCALITGIVFGIVAMALEVGSIGDFIGMFTQYHTGEAGKQYFALSEPASFSITRQFRGMAGGVFTTFFLFASDNSAYTVGIIGIAAVMLLLLAYFIIQGRKNRVINSFFILYAIWFGNYFFFAPDDRNAWVYLLVPVWLSVCIALDTLQKEGLSILLGKRRLPERLKTLLTPVCALLVVLLLVNNSVVFANAHFNRGENEIFALDVEDQITDENAIIIVDDGVRYFFAYFTEVEAVNFQDVVGNPELSGRINSTMGNGTPVYLAEYWLLDSYINKGSPRTEATYEARLELHRMIVAAFDSMYSYDLAFETELSDVYIITG